MTWEVKHEREEPEKRLSLGSILKNHARVEDNDSTMLSSLVLVRSICEIKVEHSVSQVFPRLFITLYGWNAKVAHEYFFLACLPNYFSVL